MHRPKILWLLFVTFLFQISAADRERNRSATAIVGTVYCDTCFQQAFSKTSHFISGASVSVECGEGQVKTRFHRQVKTNKYGEFKVRLPDSIGKHTRKIKRCSVRLVSSTEPYCAVASMATSSSLHLKSNQAGTHIYSAGFFTFKPLKQPELCDQKPNLANFPPFPPLNQLPPLPTLPKLPSLPNLGPFRKPPPFSNKGSLPKPVELSNPSPNLDNKPYQPTFLFTPPSIPFLPPIFGIPLPPNPLNPPSVFPPNPLQPSPPFFNLPPLPMPMPTPPPQPPLFSLPFPPIPFIPPSPLIPGIPPASKSKQISP